MAKILKNTTVNPVTIKDTGITVPASPGTYTIPPQDYLLWAASVDIVSIVNAGTLIVNNGSLDLSAAEGLRYLEYAERPVVKSGGTRVTGAVKEFNFTGGISASDNGDGSVTVATGSANPVQGRSFTINVGNNGATANKWLFFTSTSDAMDTVPYHAAWDLEIFGVTFTNKNAFTDCDVEFYVNGTTNPFKVHTMQVRGYLHYFETTLTNFFSINRGDDLAIFIRKVGAATPSSVVIQMNMRIISTTAASGGDND